MSETTEEELHVRPSGPCDAQRAVPQAEPVPTGRSGKLGRFDPARPGWRSRGRHRLQPHAASQNAGAWRARGGLTRRLRPR